MIRWPADRATLAPEEQFALALLVDLARLVPVEEDVDADVVHLVVVGAADDAEASLDLRTRIAQGWGIASSDGEVRIPRATLRAITAVTGAGVEQRSPIADRYGRVPAAENPLVAVGLEREPIISQAAEQLRAAVINAAGRRPLRFVPAWPGRKSWAAAFTHDLDVVAWWPLFTAVRSMELARKGEGGRVLAAWSAAARATIQNPVLDGVRDILRLERTLGITSTWFVLCGTPTFRTMQQGDLTYLPESKRARTAFAAIREGGHELGLHGSFATMDDHDVFRSQRRRLASLIGHDPEGVRQHFLRMRPGETQEGMVAAGFRYDATFGFSDRSGFRLGVADVIPAWNEPAKRILALDEVPLTWMDRAASKYRGVEDPSAWADDALACARACRAVGGLWVGLWHPNLTPPLGFPGAPAAFERIARTIAEWEPFVAPLSRIVAWRAARRSVRVERLMPDGRVAARADVRGDEPIVLEDANGQARESVPVAQA